MDNDGRLQSLSSNAMHLDTPSYLILAIAVVYLISRWFAASTHKLRHIPTIGSSGIVFSYFDAFRFFQNGHKMIQEGYETYYGSAFKVSNMGRWVVMISGPEMLEDLRKATDDQISFVDAVKENLQTEYTLGRQISEDPYHIGIIRTPLTRNLGVRFSDIKDEVSAAFQDLLPVTEDEWTSFPALEVLMRVVCRTSNRLFVGLPLCRDPSYMKLNERFTVDVVLRGQLINMFPSIFRPVVGRLISKISVDMKKAISLLGPLIREGLEQDMKEWPDKPNNLISWLLDEAQGAQRTVEDVALRLLAVNFAAIHTTSHALANALLDLAAHPEYLEPMREEVEAVIQGEGWTKASMGKMRKVDSFIKESQRLSVGAVSLTRKVLQDFTFSNGISVPAGTHVAFCSYGTHMDERYYANPQEFQGFRFLELRKEEGENIKHQIVSLSSDNVTFGTGRHACPGRFFAANELKAIVAYVVLNYEIKMPGGGSRPENLWFAANPFPNPTAAIMLRKRREIINR